MSDVKSASLRWTGHNLDLETTLGSGYTFTMASPAGDLAGGSPMEFLLAGVAGCTAMDVIHVLQKMRQAITDVEVRITGLRADTHPRVYTEANLIYIVRGHNIDPAALERAIELSQEIYCSASILFKRAGVRLNVEYQIEEAAPASPSL